jgi:3-oxoacyl-[acyl-carrier-protein] synthase II
MTAPREDGEGAADAMRMAMADAEVEPQEIAYINAHGTGTPLNDRCETMAVRKAFGDAAENLVMSSTKSMMGHALGASGGLESILTVEALRKQMAPPTVNYRVQDPDCDLDYAPGQAKAIRGEYAMSNSLGFGGHNASLVFRRTE